MAVPIDESKLLAPEESKRTIKRIVEDITNPMYKHTGLKLWGLFLLLMLIISGYAYFIQFRDGLGVTGLHDYVSWGAYISNFVFFVATSLVGMLISAVLGLTGIKWITPIARIGEIVAVAFAMWAGLVIVIDMGRPDRLLNVFIHGRIQSPIVWDITVVSTYVVISLLLLVLPLIPDMAIMKRYLPNAPTWQKKLFNILSFGWVGNKEQHKILFRAIRILLITIVPVALAIHTVTSWLFASTLRPGWDSTIFGPYFVSGAFVAGVAAVIIAMYFFRTNFKLKQYLNEDIFNNIGKLLVLTALVYLYFNLNEYLVPGYKMRKMEGHHLTEIFSGHYAPLFWSTQIFGLLLPIVLLLFKKMRKPKPLLIIAIFVLVGGWLKRYLIVVPTMLSTYFPIQNVPDSMTTYSVTGLEVVLTIFPVIGAIIVMTIIAKLFPVIPIWETATEQGVRVEDMYGEEK